jgi:SAM-dependent methyltransferase
VPFGDDEFDAVVLHRVMCHIGRQDLVLNEAFRVLRATGKLAVFDGDYVTITLATVTAGGSEMAARRPRDRRRSRSHRAFLPKRAHLRWTVYASDAGGSHPVL